MSLWEQLLVYASRQGAERLPARVDLWESTEKLLQLQAIVEQLTREFEQYRTSSQAEIDRLRLQVEVLQAHDTRRRDG
jgi:hypothetical protein